MRFNKGNKSSTATETGRMHFTDECYQNASLHFVLTRKTGNCVALGSAECLGAQVPALGRLQPDPTSRPKAL